MAMTLRPTDTTDTALARLAERWNISKHAAAIRAIEETAARVDGLGEVERLAVESLARWPDVYEALSHT